MKNQNKIKPGGLIDTSGLASVDGTRAYYSEQKQNPEAQRLRDQLSFDESSASHAMGGGNASLNFNRSDGKSFAMGGEDGGGENSEASDEKSDSEGGKWDCEAAEGAKDAGTSVGNLKSGALRGHILYSNLDV